MSRKRMKFVLGLAGLVWAASSPLNAQEMRPALTTALAKEIINGCEVFAGEKGWRLNIAVYDQGKNMLAFLRMDGSQLGSIDIAQWKANAASAFPRSTKGAADTAKTFSAIGFAPNIAIFEGGEAIFTDDGIHIGGVGVSGARGFEDAECARAGLDAAGLKYAPPAAN